MVALQSRDHPHSTTMVRLSEHKPASPMGVVRLGGPFCLEYNLRNICNIIII